MMYREDDEFGILACWWVALKFEQPATNPKAKSAGDKAGGGKVSR